MLSRWQGGRERPSPRGRFASTHAHLTRLRRRPLARAAIVPPAVAARSRGRPRHGLGARAHRAGEGVHRRLGRNIIRRVIATKATERHCEHGRRECAQIDKAAAEGGAAEGRCQIPCCGRQAGRAARRQTARVGAAVVGGGGPRARGAGAAHRHLGIRRGEQLQNRRAG